MKVVVITDKDLIGIGYMEASIGMVLSSNLKILKTNSKSLLVQPLVGGNMQRIEATFSIYYTEAKRWGFSTDYAIDEKAEKRAARERDFRYGEYLYENFAERLRPTISELIATNTTIEAGWMFARTVNNFRATTLESLCRSPDEDIDREVSVISDFNKQLNEKIGQLQVIEENPLPQPFGYVAIDLSNLASNDSNERCYTVLPEEKPHTYCHLNSVASQVARIMYENGDTYETLAVFELHPVALEELDPLVQDELRSLRLSQMKELMPLIQALDRNEFRDWLAAKPSDTIIGLSLNACKCPIANFLKERSFYNVEVDANQIAAELPGSSFYLDLLENCPTSVVWVVQFILNLDGTSDLSQEQQVSAREALVLLEQL